MFLHTSFSGSVPANLVLWGCSCTLDPHDAPAYDTFTLSSSPVPLRSAGKRLHTWGLNHLLEPKTGSSFPPSAASGLQYRGARAGRHQRTPLLILLRPRVPARRPLQRLPFGTPAPAPAPGARSPWYTHRWGTRSAPPGCAEKGCGDGGSFIAMGGRVGDSCAAPCETGECKDCIFQSPVIVFRLLHAP